MTARLFRCNITNSGGAPIVWISDHLDHGEWADESLPTQTANTINPGQTGHYQAESGGDIPVLGSLMTGTEGWVAFRTTNLSGTSEYFKVTHCLPYWGPKRGAQVEAMRYDPTIVPGTTEFDTRDTTPATISINRFMFSPHDDVAEFQSLPWLIVWSVGQIFTVPNGDFHWHLSINVSATAPAAPTTIPFPTTPPPAVGSLSFRFSSPQMWRGVWDSDDGRVTAVISVQENGLLNVSVAERAPGSADRIFEATDVPISRTRQFEIARIFDQIPLLHQHAELLTGISPRMFEVERQGGNEFETVEIISDAHELYGSTVAAFDRDHDIVSLPKPLEYGGDFLSLPNGGVLEIKQLTAEGQILGYDLRYVRPGFVPVLVVAGIDTVLHPRIRLN